MCCTGVFDVQDRARSTWSRRLSGRAWVHDTSAVGRPFTVGVQRWGRTVVCAWTPSPKPVSPAAAASSPSLSAIFRWSWWRERWRSAHYSDHHRHVGARLRRCSGRRAGAHIIGCPTGVRARIGQAANVRGGRVRRHPFGPRRLRATVTGQARGARHCHPVWTDFGTATAGHKSSEKAIGGGMGEGNKSAAAGRPRTTPSSE